MGFQLTTLVVIDTDCTDSFKSNYHMFSPTLTQLQYFLLTVKVRNRLKDVDSVTLPENKLKKKYVSSQIDKKNTK